MERYTLIVNTSTVPVGTGEFVREVSNLWEPERMRRLGFEYHSIGRRPVLPA